MTEAHVPVREQIVQLEDSIDRLWWFAQFERAVEMRDNGREPMVGSKEVLNRIASEKEPLSPRDMFDMQYDAARLGLAKEYSL